MISTLAIAGYRSLRDVVVPLERLTVVCGGNGVGKTNLYQGFRLLSEVASGNLIGGLAEQGGLESAAWAGPETISGAMRRGEVPVQGSSSRSKPVSLMWGFASDDFGYLLDIGLPVPTSSRFAKDPEIKRELIFAGELLRPASILVERMGGQVATRGQSRQAVGTLTPRESLIDEFAGYADCPEVAGVRAALRRWRFYSSFRTDAASPARAPHVCTRTPVLSHDGGDLSPALATIVESAWAPELHAVIHEAFDGAELHFDGDQFVIATLLQPGVLRPLTAAEWSDGTLRFLLWCAALLSPQPPGLLVLNEPETSLHPRLLAPLARLIASASQRTQVLVVTHASLLVDYLGDVHRIDLVKDLGETRVEGQGLLTKPAWNWGRR